MKNKFSFIVFCLFTILSCNSESKKGSTAYEAERTLTGDNLHDELNISSADWRWSDYNFNQFSEFTVTLSNKTYGDYTRVKYRITLLVNENGVLKEVFSKSYDHNDVIYSGDIIKLPVYDLSNFYMGVDVRDVANWSWTGEIEEARLIMDDER